MQFIKIKNVFINVFGNVLTIQNEIEFVQLAYILQKGKNY